MTNAKRQAMKTRVQKKKVTTSSRPNVIEAASEAAKKWRETIKLRAAS